VDYFERALRAHPVSDAFNASLHNNLGALYCETGRCSDGATEFERAIESAPNDPSCHTNLANAFGVLGRYGEARAELEKAYPRARLPPRPGRPSKPG
jgi:Flp pilus assembly protein TadD